ncbi:N-acetylmuramoyl-L-alanine amidase [Campylobacter showae]|uniref:N-acetylmuramoyl-L-alanine amidase family protein n=1 Tax=Campylobacter showae TaxID=204 RepID=UPI000586FBA2|nr:N-acetylmuramoyl-L-alanine amidase [Campylobacter showae]QCD48580.1 N-acetylmuramoyl-L-alanine amidase [Campylobacter showae]
MAKIVKLFLILLFFLNSAVCASALSSLDKFDKNFDSAANKEKIAMHQELRTLYVKSIMENNVNLRVQSLTRLIKSSKALGLDTKPYEKELASIPQSAKPSEEKPKQEIKQVKKEQQKQEPKQKEVKLSQLSSAPLAVQNTKTVKNQTLQLLEALDNDGNFELKFNRQLNGNDIKKTDLNQKGSYKTIYEFKGIWSGGKLQRFKNYLVDEIRISQFDEKIVRVVFVSQFEPNLKLRVDNQSLIFSKAKPTQSQNLTSQNSKQKNHQPSIKQELPKIAANSKSEITQIQQQKATQHQAQNQKLAQQKQEKVAAQTKTDAKKTQSTTEKDEQEIVLAPVKTAATKKTTSAKGKVVVLDAGHGGDDPGAINGSLKEKNIVLSIAQKAGKELQERGYKVYYTRSKDKFINLRDRTKYANDKAADLFISIHANAAPSKTKAATMRGIETFFLSPARSERSKNAAALENKSDIEEMNYFSKQTFLNFLNREKIIASNKLAIDVQREVLARAKSVSSKASDGGVREAPFWVLVGALMPAVLLEVGYITHPSEGDLINNSKYQDALAKGLADGIDVYFSNQQ